MVVIKSALAAILAAGTFIAPTVAHPGEHHDHDEVKRAIAKRSEHAMHIQRSLAACAGKPSYERLKRQGQERRFKKAQELRKKRNIPLDSGYYARRLLGLY